MGKVYCFFVFLPPYLYQMKREIWQVSYPIMLGLIAQNVINVTDTAFLGRVGEVELGASAIGGLLYIAVFMIGFGFGVGSQILMARRNGEGKQKEIGQIFDQSMNFLFLLAVGLWVIIWFASPLFLNKIISSPEVYEKSIDYINYRSFGIFFAFSNVLFRSFYVSIKRTMLITWAAVVMAVVNIVFDYLLIFGHAGFPEMGIAGAGLASLISEASAMLFLFYMSYKKTIIEKYDIFRLRKFNRHVIAKTLDVGFYVMVQHFIAFGGWFVFFLIIEQIGERSLAISNIIRSLYMVLMIPLWGFASTVSSMVSNAIGEGNGHNVIPLIKNSAYLSLYFSLGILPFLLLFPDIILRVYTDDNALIAATVPVLYVIAFALLGLSFAVPLFHGVSGTGNTFTALVIELITIGFYLLVTWFIAVVIGGSVTLIWCSEFIYLLFLGGLSALYLRSGKWTKKKL